MDLRYIDTWTFWLDLKLLLLTIPAVLSGRGAY
jgi:lipopolysaccharide/colanic/teichoic acid biosynthesis glycosyltransferase